jgi:hypothetical protein
VQGFFSSAVASAPVRPQGTIAAVAGNGKDITVKKEKKKSPKKINREKRNVIRDK